MNCGKCEEKGTMQPFFTNKFSPAIVNLGRVVGLISFLGFLFACFATLANHGSIILCLLFVAGFFLWHHLITKKKIFKCSKCGFVIDKDDGANNFNNNLSTSFLGGNVNMIKLDCKACNNDKTMHPTEIAKFSGIVIVIGWIIAIPSIIGVFIATIMLVTGADGSEFTGLRIGISVTIGLFSLVGGLLGYLLIMKKKVFKCNICGFVMDRA